MRQIGSFGRPVSGREIENASWNFESNLHAFALQPAYGLWQRAGAD
jgi:hypothetical protein